MILKNLEANSNTVISENNIDFHIINSHVDLQISSLISCDAIIFRTDRTSLVQEEIQKIRKADNPALYLKPIFVSTRRVKNRLQHEVDGVVEASDLSSIEERTRELITLIKQVNPAPISSHLPHLDRVILKTMQYMFTREIALEPIRSRNALIGYHFPFVRTLLPDFEIAGLMDKIDIAVEKNWLKAELVDRINLCRSCGGSYLHFVETCHKCQSIDIETENLIHHFRCAYIGPESDFKQEEILMCPKCDKVLRHIGVDYDKPSEILNCNSCNHQAQQSTIKASCIDCGDDNELGKLGVKEMKKIELTTEGKAIAISSSDFQLADIRPEVTRHVYELENQVFDLFTNQEIKKTVKSKLKSYNFKIDFDIDILEDLSSSEKSIFTEEFKNILGNYLEDVDLMTMREINSYELLLATKPAHYVKDMKETLIYNLDKIINDNFNDPAHELSVSYATLDNSFLAKNG